MLKRDSVAGNVILLMLQEEINQLVKWAERWQMEFNPDECEMMHFGSSNKSRIYTMSGKVLQNVEEQRDLGAPSPKIIQNGRKTR